MNKVIPGRIVSLLAVLVPQVVLTAALAGAQTPGSTAAAITGRITDEPAGFYPE